MLVSGPTHLNAPLNTAHLPTEAIKTENTVAERIPESVGSNASSGNKGANAENALNDSARTEFNTELREKIFGTKNANSQVDSAADGANKPQAEKQASEQSSKQPQSADSEVRAEQQQQRQDLATIRKLAAIDRRVKAHEQAHASVGGVYAGAPNFTYQTGPNGVRYAVAGEVPIDTSGVSGDPQATLRKAEQVARAALAPADPSSTDRRVASSAQALASKARFEIARLAAERIQANRGQTQAKINGEEVDTDTPLKSSTSFAGGQLHAALATDATEQVGGQVSASA